MTTMLAILAFQVAKHKWVFEETGLGLMGTRPVAWKRVGPTGPFVDGRFPVKSPVSFVGVYGFSGTLKDPSVSSDVLVRFAVAQIPKGNSPGLQIKTHLGPWQKESGFRLRTGKVEMGQDRAGMWVAERRVGKKASYWICVWETGKYDGHRIETAEAARRSLAVYPPIRRR